MMNFDLNEEQLLVEKSVREWGAREIAPRIRELDRAHKFDPNIQSLSSNHMYQYNVLIVYV